VNTDWLQKILIEEEFSPSP